MKKKNLFSDIFTYIQIYITINNYTVRANIVCDITATCCHHVFFFILRREERYKSRQANINSAVPAFDDNMPPPIKSLYSFSI